MEESPRKKVMRWGAPGSDHYSETVYTYYFCKQCNVIGVKKEEANNTLLVQGEISQQLGVVRK